MYKYWKTKLHGNTQLSRMNRRRSKPSRRRRKGICVNCSLSVIYPHNHTISRRCSHPSPPARRLNSCKAEENRSESTMPVTCGIQVLGNSEIYMYGVTMVHNRVHVSIVDDNQTIYYVNECLYPNTKVCMWISFIFPSSFLVLSLDLLSKLEGNFSTFH